MSNPLKINEQRLLKNIHELAQIGQTADGGVSRLALSEADKAGRDWFRTTVKAAGLEFRADEAGNLSAIFAAAEPTAKTLLAGSHLDTVPNGGRFDGALGVLSALEALQTIREANLTLPHHLEAISFTDEEGTLSGLLGSRAFTGQLAAPDLAQVRLEPDQFQAGLERLGLSRAGFLTAQRDPETLAGYIELHIEQGTRLEEAGLDIGVVTSIVGIRSYWLQFTGQAGHAGTTPMDKRADAMWGASAFVGQARELVMKEFPAGVMNCGQLHLSPGAFNIIPAEARLALEFRNGTEALLDQMETALLKLANDVARDFGLSLVAEEGGTCIAAPMDLRIVEAIEQAVDTLGLKHTRLLSLAGHDAQTLSTIVPSALFFVPSVDGLSHNPREFTRDEDVINGANVMLLTLLELVSNCG